MLHQVYTVYDVKAESYLRPFYFRTKAEAIRAFSSLADEKGHSFNVHPEDYVLFELGSFDETNALFSMHLTPIPLGSALEFKTKHLSTASPHTTVAA